MSQVEPDALIGSTLGPSARVIKVDPNTRTAKSLPEVVEMRPMGQAQVLDRALPKWELTGGSGGDGETGLMWGLLVTAPTRLLLARPTWFQTKKGVAADVKRVLARLESAEIVYVSDKDSGRISWWLVSSKRVLLVAVRSWPATQVRVATKHALDALSTLRGALSQNSPDAPAIWASPAQAASKTPRAEEGPTNA